MSYKSIYKYFVSNEKVNDIYSARYNSESSYHFPISINKHPAFFFLHPDISNKISKIRMLDKEVELAFSSLPDFVKDQYKKKCLIDEIIHTNSIEGIISTKQDITNILENVKTKSLSKERLEGLVNKYQYMNSTNIRIKSSKDIRKIYDDMLLLEVTIEDECNRPDGTLFRKETVSVNRSDDKAIHQGITPESKIIEYMDVALDILNDDSVDSILRISIFHYLFGYIHPFYDGNGRLNRFITSYMLHQTLSSLMPYRLSNAIKENISVYYNAFKYTNDTRNMGDISTFVYSFLDIIIYAYESTKVYTNKIKDRIKELEHKINLLNLPSNHKSVLLYLSEVSIFENLGTSKSVLCSSLNISDSTCRRIILDLKKMNMIQEHKISKSIYYSASII